MRSHVEFRSQALLEQDTDDPGESVARLLVERLSECGYQIKEAVPEDWGWRIDIGNAAFPLWVGCGRYEQYDDGGYLVFIDPSTPYVRRGLKRLATSETVEALAGAIDQVLRQDGRVYEVRWWAEDEVR